MGKKKYNVFVAAAINVYNNNTTRFITNGYKYNKTNITALSDSPLAYEKIKQLIKQLAFYNKLEQLVNNSINDIL